MSNNRSRVRGLNCLELLIVVVILGIVAAVVIPRMSHGGVGAADSPVGQSLSMLRTALDLYATEHGGKFPSVVNFADALTKCSNGAGDSHSAAKDPAHPYGPYLHRIPVLPVGVHRGQNGVATISVAPPVAETGGTDCGWLYDRKTGQIWANDLASLKM